MVWPIVMASVNRECQRPIENKRSQDESRLNESRVLTLKGGSILLLLLSLFQNPGNVNLAFVACFLSPCSFVHVALRVALVLKLAHLVQHLCWLASGVGNPPRLGEQ